MARRTTTVRAGNRGRGFLTGKAFPIHVVPAVLVGYACLLPREFALDLGGFALFPYRLMLLLVAPFIIRPLATGQVKLRAVDGLAIFASIWYVVALIASTSTEAALETGLANAADVALAYFVGRASIRTYEDFRKFLYAMLPGLAVISAFIAVEAIGQRLILRPIAADIAGQPRPFLYDRARFGLKRGMGPFPHPILAGVFMASIFPLAWFTFRAKGIRHLFGVTIALAGTFFTVSSAAVVSLLLAAFFVALTVVQRMLRLTIWPFVAAFTALAALFIEFASGSGLLSFLLRNLTFESGSAWYRRLIWHYAGDEVWNHPIFGIGLRDWKRPSWMVLETVDAHWLLQAMRYGLPLSLSILILLLAASVIALRDSRGQPRNERNIAVGLSIAIFSLGFAGFSVALWEGVACWMLMLAGMALTVGQRNAAIWRPLPTPRASTAHHGARRHPA